MERHTCVDVNNIHRRAQQASLSKETQPVLRQTQPVRRQTADCQSVSAALVVLPINPLMSGRGWTIGTNAHYATIHPPQLHRRPHDDLPNHYQTLTPGSIQSWDSIRRRNRSWDRPSIHCLWKMVKVGMLASCRPWSSPLDSHAITGCIIQFESQWSREWRYRVGLN